VNRRFWTGWLTWTANWRSKMLLLSMIALSLGCGCLTRRVVVIPADRQVLPVSAGKAFLPPVNGWFVPQARMQEMLHALERKAEP